MAIIVRVLILLSILKFDDIFKTPAVCVYINILGVFLPTVVTFFELKMCM